MRHARSASFVPSFDFIRSYLSDVRVRVRRQFATCALIGLGVVWIALAIALPLLASAIAPGRATSIALLGAGGLIAVLAVAGAIIVGAVVPLRRYASDAAMARWIGGRSKPIASDLLSTVELHASAGGPGAPSPVLIGALTEQTAHRLKALDRASLVDPRPEHQAWAALGGVAAIATVLFVFASGATLGGWRRLLAAPERPWNGATLSSVPLVGDVTITLTPPAYSRRPPTVLTSTSGDFRALAGTTARITTNPLEPAAAVAIVVERGTADAPAEPEVVPLLATRDGMAVELPITGPARYRFQIDTPRKQKKIETVSHAIEIEPDAAPTIELYAPAEELDVTNMKRIELAYVGEDDFGIAAIELVWEINGRAEKKSVGAFAEQPGRAQGKLVWDLAEMTLPPGAEVVYHLEIVDGDTVEGPNRGSSRPFRLRVFSPRERHQQNLERQAELAEHVVTQLGIRLTAADGEIARDELHRGLDELAVEAGTLAAAYADDPLADPTLRTTITGLRDRLAKLSGAEERLNDKAAPRAPRPAARFAAFDKQAVTELEDDALLLADWLQREQMEGMLDIADEIDAHQKRLAELLAEYARTGDDKLKAEIARELHAIDQRMAELAHFRSGIAEDVLDQFVHADAMADRRAAGCMDEVEKLAMAGDAAGAQAALERCRRETAGAAQSLEDALHQLRGDRFTDAEKKLDELMNELTDLAQDQTDIAAEADRIFERYAERADELMHDLGKDARHKLGATVDKLKERLGQIPDNGLTPFAREELQIAGQRVADLERMLEDGDVAEALGMAKQARQSLETVAGELDAAMADDPSSPWAQATSDAIDGVERAHPLADRLVDELEQMTPSPDQILGDDDKRRLDALKRRQAMTRDRAKQLAEKAKSADGVPGDAAQAIDQRVGEASGPMTQAEKRMGGRDPSGARDAARTAADALQKAKQEAQKAARQAQSQGDAALGDEPVRIPGADQYVAPEEFRKELLEAMKKRPPSGYDDQVKRYYEELIR